MKTIGSRSTCPIGYSLDVFGDKWTLLLLRDMIFAEKNRKHVNNIARVIALLAIIGMVGFSLVALFQ